MIISLDADRKLQIDEPRDFTSFCFRSDGEQALESTAAIEFDGDAAWVAESALRTWPPMVPESAWQDGLTAMIDFARPRGWVNAETGRIRAHIERRRALPARLD